LIITAKHNSTFGIAPASLLPLSHKLYSIIDKITLPDEANYTINKLFMTHLTLQYLLPILSNLQLHSEVFKMTYPKNEGSRY